MDDDIDIEEHDLLDNPAIQKIFPDLSILKKEISGYFDEASVIKREPDTIKSQEYCNVSDSNTSDLDTEKVEVSQNFTSEINKTEKAQIPLLGNKIILGSKPTLPTKINLNETGHRDIYAAKVNLNDIGSYLARSERFCKICYTMFPHKRNFMIHNTTVHKHASLSKTIEIRNGITTGSIAKNFYCNECCESFSQLSLLRRHKINVHRKKCIKDSLDSNHTSLQTSSPLRMIMGKSAKCNQCFHCKVSFSSKKLLIEHIYMVLQSKRRKPGTKILKTRKQSKNDQASNSSKVAKRVIKKKRVRNLVSNHLIKITNGNIKNKNVPVKSIKTKTFQSNAKKLQNKQLIYQCLYCSYIFSEMKFCLNHLVNKHKDFTITTVKAVIFNEQCKFCSKKNNNWKLHNIHMQMYHKEKVDKTIKVYPKICLPKVDQIYLSTKQVSEQKVSKNDKSYDFVAKEIEMDFSEPLHIEKNIEEEDSNSINNNQLLLKSILFKCKRCDIHFLSAESAMNHADHMELLINWKCLSCNKIFKKVDEKLHMKQHSISNNFTVFQLTESQLARILYKCSKCAIHFDANGYRAHFRKCELAVSESIYCRVCDILIDKGIGGSHENYHTKKKLKPIDFTILNSDVIGAESTVKTVARSTVKKMRKKKPHVSQFCFKLSYCKTCNSFISKKGRNLIVHVESRCAHLPTYICQFCGLIFTNKTMATHKIMHKDRKSIRLQDFTFYSFRGSKQILPPIPEYPKCKSCHVHFISKVAIVNHVCNEDFLTCHICNIKLSEPVFKLHMSFHYYSKTSKNENSLSEDKTNLTKTSEMCEEKLRTPRPPPRKRKMSASGSSTDSAELREPEFIHAVNKQLSEKNQSDRIEDAIVNNPHKDGTKVVSEEMTAENKLITIKNKNLVQTYKPNLDDRKSDFALYNVLYCCRNCRTTIDTYDAVVEHCQEHLCGVDIEQFGCEICKLKLDRKSYENHKEFHAMQATNNKSFILLEFDTFYFTLDNSVWIKHVFQNVDHEKSRQILNRSIYRYGGKIKMQIIQKGSSDLTVYKCNSCFVIVDPDSLLKHVENSCFKARKHPCSYCGLPFMSYMSLKTHLNIHKKMNISFKSYRIVIINQEKDKNSNKVINGPIKYFLLYKCRNCNGVIDTYQRQTHTSCNEKDLKKCSICDLLFYSADFKGHMHKHELVCNFVPKNMKIVLFGQGPVSTIDENPLNQTWFGGNIVDFTFIQCVKCGVCIDKSPMTPWNHHTCYEDSLISKCTKCELNILKSKFARHNKLHDINVHFVKDNINIIPYDHSKQLSNFIPADLNRLNSQESLKTDICNSRNDKHIKYSNDTKGLVNQTINFATPQMTGSNLKMSKKNAKLFKCSCGLHFLDKTTIYEHLDHCNSEKTKQHCSKCNLLFTPTVLFTHLLLHHGDKKYIYTFKIVEMSKTKNVIVTLFNCVNCKTHFLEYNKAMIHFEKCKDFEVDKKECPKCKLYFSSCSIAQHETLHHDEKVADIEIVDVTTENVSLTDQNKTDARSIDNVTVQADLVRESKYNISDENLSQIDLSRYSNTIYKCEKCNTHFLTQHTFKRHFANGKHVLSPQDTCNICELRFSLQSLTKHIYIHHKQMQLNAIDFIIKSNI